MEAVADEIGGEWVQVDVADRDSVERAVAQAGEVDLLVANAGIADNRGARPGRSTPPTGGTCTRSTCSASISAAVRSSPGCWSAAAAGSRSPEAAPRTFRGGARTAYPPSKAAACRYGETLANELAGRIPVFFFSPGLVRTEMTDGAFPDDAPWTPPELAPELVRKLATGRYDALAGRYLHAEHDDLDALLERIDEVRERDLNAIRLRR